MNRVIVSIAACVPLFVGLAGACDGIGGDTCATDADCAGSTNDLGDETPICDESVTVCVPAECSADDECQVTDAGLSDSCQDDSDCNEDQPRCVQGSSDTKHCVAEQGDADPSCDDQESGDFDLTEVTVDGVTFCGDTAVSCSESRCTGGSFDG
jgi:hypothetical protein